MSKKEREDIDYIEEVKIRSSVVKDNIEAELKEGRYVEALLLAHTIMHNFLIEMLLVSGEGQNLSKNEVKAIYDLQFWKLCVIHHATHRISDDLFKGLEEFNMFRNHILHQYAAVNFETQKTKSRMERFVAQGLALLYSVENSLNKVRSKRFYEVDEKLEKG
jgi:hypothetical protein